MVSSCIKCMRNSKLEDVRITNRTWHRFPNKLKKPFLHQTWLNFVERTRVGNCATICSDHFLPHDYKNLKSKRLKNDAVPSKINSTFLFNILIERSLNVNDSPSDSEIEQKTNPTLVSPSDSEAKQVTNIALATLCNNIESYSEFEPTTGSVPLPDLRTPKPRNRKLDGLARTDFVTDEAWNIYRTNHLKLKTQIKTQKITMSRRKVAMEKLISDLKSKTFSKSAEYLQELPETMKEILCRMDKSSRILRGIYKKFKSRGRRRCLY